MKNLIGHLPKPLLALLILLLVGGVAYGAYLICTIQGEVTVEESISVTPTSFDLTLYPGESRTQEISITNVSGVDMIVSLSISVSPAGLDVACPTSIEIKKHKTERFDIEVEVPLNIAPGIYTITVDVSRG